MSKKQKAMKISGLFCTLLYFIVLVPGVFAQSPTPTVKPTKTVSPTPTISEEEVKNSLQERLKKAAQEKGEAADQVLGAKNKLAVVGKLSDRSEERRVGEEW